MRLDDDPALRHLIGALALGEGFQFHIVIGRSPRQIKRLADQLPAAVAQRRSAPAQALRLAPYDELPRDRAIEAHELSDWLSPRLAAPPAAASNTRIILLLDATPADETEEAAWRTVFRRLNEQRNALMRDLGAAFLLCLPPWLEAPFAHEAPDFWSIRGVSAELPRDEPAAESPIGENLLRPIDRSFGNAQHGIGAQEGLDERILAAQERAAARPEDPVPLRALIILREQRGDLHRRHGNSLAALTDYQAALAVAEALIRHDPANTQWQRDLSVSHEKIGDVRVAQGDGPGALAAYRKSLDIAEALARRDPANTEWQRDLSVSHDRIGDVLRAQGDLPGALAAYRKSLDIREALVRHDPANTEWQRDLSVSHIKIGNVRVAQGDGPSALAAYRKSLDIAEALARRDPANTEWQRDLSVSHIKVGDVRVAQGDGPGALAAYRKSLDIREALVRHDPANTQWQRDLSVSHNKIGDVRVAQGDPPGALAAYRKSLDIAEALARRDPANAQWQRDLIVSYVKLSEALGDRRYTRKALEVAQAMAGKGVLAPVDAWMIDELKRRASE